VLFAHEQADDKADVVLRSSYRFFFIFVGVNDDVIIKP